MTLPDHDDETSHVVAAEVEFSAEVTSRAGLVLGGRSRSDVTSELTGVPVRVRSGAKLSVDALQGALRKGDEPLQIVAVEKGPALLLLVRDTDHTEALGKLGSGGQTTFVTTERGSMPQFDPDFRRYDLRFDDEDRVRFIWPRASRAGSSDAPTELFDASRDFTGKLGGLHWLLTRVSHPLQKVNRERFADAVAVAGLQAFAAYTRRAVVLVLGKHIDDASQYSPAAVRAYLEKVRVPLFVWSLDGGTAGKVAATWGSAEDVSSFPKLRSAYERLRREIDSQQIVWVAGRHLPQQVALDTKASGVELVQ